MTFKPLSQRKRDDLFDLAIECEILIAEDATKTEILQALEEAGVTNKRLRQLEEKQEAEKVSVEVAADVPLSEIHIADGKCVVYMSRDNRSFLYRGHVFNQKNRLVLMDVEDADHLIKVAPGFRKLSREEVASYYK